MTFAIVAAIVATVVRPLVWMDEMRSDLAWSPPELNNPTTIKLGTGSTYTLLEQGEDYIIDLPNAVKYGNTMIEGGRNVVIIGGHITVPPGGESDTQRRGLYFKNTTGTVHIEGLMIDGEDEQGFDGISISAPRAIVQIQNVRIVGVTGRFDGFHGDMVQPFGGVEELLIDHLTGTSNYQGFYLTETRGAIGSVSISNVNLRYETNTFDETTYLIWLPVDPDTCAAYPVDLENVYVEPRDGQQAAGFAVWPNTVQPPGCTAVEDGRAIFWPELDAISGTVTDGSPVLGDYVPARSVGESYGKPDHPPGGEGAPGVLPDKKFGLHSRRRPVRATRDGR